MGKTTLNRRHLQLLPDTADWESRVRGLRVLTGNTPLLAIDCEVFDQPRTIYAKAENLNFTGSIKDRMALYIIRRGYETGALEPRGHIIEATSGNTGISFAALGRALGHRVTIFMPEWMSEERKALIRSFGATVRLVSPAEGGFLGSIQLAEELARRDAGFIPPAAVRERGERRGARGSTGPEIWEQLRWHGTHTRRIRRRRRDWRDDHGSRPLLPAGESGGRPLPGRTRELADAHTGHKVGKHRIQGISDEFIPPIVD